MQALFMANHPVEEWRPIPRFPDHEASSLGNIRRVTPSKRSREIPYLLNPCLNKKGYRYVTLVRPKDEPGVARWRPYFVNRLVCAAFHGPPPSPTHHAAHNNGNKTDNSAENLRWATPLENGADQYIHGTRMRGTRSGLAKIDEAMALRIIEMRAEGISWSRIAEHACISVRSCREIVNGKTWRHVRTFLP